MNLSSFESIFLQIPTLSWGGWGLGFTLTHAIYIY
jgi:hypothetical protein